MTIWPVYIYTERIVSKYTTLLVCSFITDQITLKDYYLHNEYIVVDKENFKNNTLPSNIKNEVEKSTVECFRNTELFDDVEGIALLWKK